MTPHKENHEPQWHIAESYDAAIVGAPFKVTLMHSVRVRTNSLGDEEIQIPDTLELISEIVRLRVTDSRKLAGPDIRFIRKALGIKSSKLAVFLDFTAEHYSRLEAGDRVMGPNGEKMFRLFAFAATFQKEPEKLLDGLVNPTVVEKQTKKSKNLSKKFVEMFFNMEIEAVHRIDDAIAFVLQRSPELTSCGEFPQDGSDGDWEDLTPVTPKKAA